MTSQSPDATLVLLSGDTDPDPWAVYVPGLAQAFRVVVPDLGTARSPQERVRTVHGALDELDAGSAALVGDDTGAWLALRVAAERPDVAAVVATGVIAEGTEPDRETLAAALAAREIPVLLAWGEDDDVAPLAEAEELADALPMSTLAVIPECGHDLPRAEAATLAPLLFEWLRYRFLGESHRHEAQGPVLVTVGRRPSPAEEGLDLGEDDPEDDG